MHSDKKTGANRADKKSLEIEEDSPECVNSVLRKLDIRGGQVYLVFTFICILNVVVNFDHGAIPASLQIISKDLKIGEGKLGVLGSLVFFGFVLGSMGASRLFYLMEYKTIIVAAMLVNGLSLWMLTQYKMYELLGLTRLVSGFAQIFITLYVPLYIDTFTNKNQKVNLMPLSITSAMIGTIVGYGVTGLIINQDGGTWQQSIQFLSYTSITSAIIAFLIPDRFFDLQKVQELKKEEIQRQAKQLDLDNSAILSQDENDTMFNSDSNRDDLADDSKSINQMSSLLNNQPYIFLTLANTVLFFVVSGVQYWATYYFVNALEVPQVTANIGFGVTAFTSPFIGSLLSGSITQLTGGYKSKRTLKLVSILGTIAMVTSASMPFQNQWKPALTLIWITFFLGAICLPIITGAFLSKVTPQARPKAISLAYFMYNLFGYLPAPVLYGMANQFYGGRQSRLGMILLMYTQSLFVVFVMLAAWSDQKTQDSDDDFTSSGKSSPREMLDDA